MKYFFSELNFPSVLCASKKLPNNTYAKIISKINNSNKKENKKQPHVQKIDFKPLLICTTNKGMCLLHRHSKTNDFKKTFYLWI